MRAARSWPILSAYGELKEALSGTGIQVASGEAARDRGGAAAGGLADRRQPLS